MTQSARAAAFRALHARPGGFVIPNPWDAGTARILAALGFEALATTSAGLAFTLGRRDGAGLVSREETLANARAIVEATDLPVAADLENCFADAPGEAAETIRLAWDVGLVGGSIEDATGNTAAPIYEFDHAVARVAAAVEVARSTGGFLLTARAENFLYGNPDLADTIKRLQAYEAAGADVLYAPGLPDLEAVRTVCASVSKPVNVIAGTKPTDWTVASVIEAGAKRISVGSALNRAALGAFLTAARDLKGGSFAYAANVTPFAELNAFMA
jgi:2-methylisocitrate lyase-like PEP mutase family enzyme